ncbi:hypothetical protein AAVH_36073 [Aphelenchoides avenae]|nr:hypothetical protein AAVH_36073 [Aphelenchus avenae]
MAFGSVTLLLLLAAFFLHTSDARPLLLLEDDDAIGPKEYSSEPDVEAEKAAELERIVIAMKALCRKRSAKTGAAKLGFLDDLCRSVRL